MPKTMPKGISCSRCVSTLPWSPRPARTKQKVEDMYDGCSSALPQYSGITVLEHQEPRYGNVGEDENHGVMAHLFPVLLQKPDSMNWNMKVVLVAPNGSSGHHEGIWGLYIYIYNAIYYHILSVCMRTSGQRVMQHCCQCHSSWRPRRHPNNQRLHKAAAKNHEGCRGTSQRSWPARLTNDNITCRSPTFLIDLHWLVTITTQRTLLQMAWRLQKWLWKTLIPISTFTTI